MDLGDADQVRSATERVWRPAVAASEALVVVERSSRAAQQRPSRDWFNSERDPGAASFSTGQEVLIAMLAVFAGIVIEVGFSALGVFLAIVVAAFAGVVVGSLGLAWSSDKSALPAPKALKTLPEPEALKTLPETAEPEALPEPEEVATRRTKSKAIAAEPERIVGASTRRLLGTSTAQGRVVDAGQLSAPATGTRCAAFQLELHHTAAQPGTLMLLHAVTSPLSIELDDGRRVRIPAGRIALGPAPPTVAAGHELDGFLDELVGVDRGPLIHDQVRERCLQIGDRVSIECELVDGPHAVEETSPFRGHVTAVLVPRGTPVLTVVARDETSQR